MLGPKLVLIIRVPVVFSSTCNTISVADVDIFLHRLIVRCCGQYFKISCPVKSAATYLYIHDLTKGKVMINQVRLIFHV